MPEQQQHHISQEVVQYSSSPSSHSDGSSIASSLDELAKGLANGTLSRGKALRLVGGALLGAALGSIPGVAWADDRCSEGQTRCGDRCVNLLTNERHCGSCSNRCRSTQTCCKGRCVNLQRNERHCGSCFNRCEEGEECVGGVCQGGGCPSGTTPCGTQCCQTGETCVNGTCCPNAQLCGTGTSLTCCAEGEECVDGVCGPPPPTCTLSCPEGCMCEFRAEDGVQVCVTCESVAGGCSVVSSCDECGAGEVCVRRGGGLLCAPFEAC